MALHFCFNDHWPESAVRRFDNPISPELHKAYLEFLTEQLKNIDPYGRINFRQDIEGYTDEPRTGRKENIIDEAVKVLEEYQARNKPAGGEIDEHQEGT